jgi:hypothetical protein
MLETVIAFEPALSVEDVQCLVYFRIKKKQLKKGKGLILKNTLNNYI